jgi:hypothetical protein
MALKSTLGNPAVLSSNFFIKARLYLSFSLRRQTRLTAPIFPIVVFDAFGG